VFLPNEGQISPTPQRVYLGLRTSSSSFLTCCFQITSVKIIDEKKENRLKTPEYVFRQSLKKLLKKANLNFDTISFLLFNLNPLQPKVFGVKFSFREIGRIFLTKIRNLKLFKMPKL